MKQVLSLLVIFVFLNVSSWAFAPNYPTTSQNVSGTYAGVLIPTTTAATTGTVPVGTTPTSASIGVFGLGIPASTDGSVFSQGAGIIFNAGTAYNTTISGVYDPGTNTLSAILEGTSDFQITIITPGTGANPTPTINKFNIFAQGNLVASLTPASNNNRSNTQSGAGTANAERLTGTASVDLFSFIDPNTGTPTITSTIQFTVSGFQQSSVFSAPTFTLPATGG